MSSSYESRGGYKLIWLISCFLFVSIAAGGGFLIMYMLLPESSSTSWLPLAGVTLVCLPWLFWFITFFYRIVSRACGFRMVIPGGGGDGGGKGDTNVGGGGDRGVTSDDDDDDEANNTVGDQGMVANNAAAATTTPSVVVLREQNNDDDDDDNNRTHQRKESSSNDESIASRESEIPLAYSMN